MNSSRIACFLFILAWGSILATCQSTTNSGFDVSTGGSNVVLIASTDSSCQGLSSTPDVAIAATYFKLPSLTISWKKMEYPLTIQWIQFTAASPDINNGQQFTCQIAGVDLLWVWTYNWADASSGTAAPACPLLTSVTFGGTINPNPRVSPPGAPGASKTDCINKATLQSYCPLKCGGIAMTEPSQSSSGTITMKVFATYEKGGETIPVIVNKGIGYSYQGI